MAEEGFNHVLIYFIMLYTHYWLAVIAVDGRNSCCKLRMNGCFVVTPHLKRQRAILDADG